MLRNHAFDIHGRVSRGFEAVREAFAENFMRRGELGGACCAFVRGEKVIDLWGGIRNKRTGEPWEQDTMVVVHSATKGLAAMTLAIAHSRGWLDYEERVCAYWPEFAQNGKERITVRQLLAHQAGLFAFDEAVDRSALLKGKNLLTLDCGSGYHGADVSLELLLQACDGIRDFLQSSKRRLELSSTLCASRNGRRGPRILGDLKFGFRHCRISS